jgi:hypothetical protein
MNIRTLAIAALVLCSLITRAEPIPAPPVEKMPTLKANGQVYSNVIIYKVTPTDIFFKSDQAIGNAKLKDLDPELQVHFHYDPNYNPTNTVHQTNGLQVVETPATNSVTSNTNSVAAKLTASQAERIRQIKATVDRVGIAVAVGVLVVFLLLWIFICYCFDRICDKCGTPSGLLIWIPFFNQIRLLQAGGLSPWLFLLFFVPFVGAVMAIYMWVKVCQARGKSGWLVILMFVPVANLLFLPYLAFSE